MQRRSRLAALGLVLCALLARADGCTNRRCGKDRFCLKGKYFSVCAKVPRRRRQCVCAEIYEPVCCAYKVRHLGFLRLKGKLPNSNACDCRCRGGRVCTRPRPKPEPLICPRIFRPVCCQDRKTGAKRTASNSCLCGSGKVLFEGTCEGGPVACPAVFDPVCCERQGKKKTEGNSCECGGGTVLFKGRCEGGRPKAPPPPREPRKCPAVFDPVCCESNGGQSTASNTCACGDGKVLFKGRCEDGPPPPREPRICAAIFDPVCCEANGERRTAGNSCVCEGDGTVVFKGEC